jgi:hypothetical protein
MTTDRLKRGDVVRATFAISGEITDFTRTGRLDFVVIRCPGELYTRRVTLDGVTKIPHCENAAIEYDLTATPTNTGFGDRYPVKALRPCRNLPEARTGRGTWLCRSCADGNVPNTGIEATA